MWSIAPNFFGCIVFLFFFKSFVGCFFFHRPWCRRLCVVISQQKIYSNIMWTLSVFFISFYSLCLLWFFLSFGLVCLVLSSASIFRFYCCQWHGSIQHIEMYYIIFVSYDCVHVSRYFIQSLCIWNPNIVESNF